MRYQFFSREAEQPTRNRELVSSAVDAGGRHPDDRGGDSVLRVVPQVFVDAPMLVSSEGDANLAVVGQDGWRQRGALASSQYNVKVVVEELNINILFGLVIRSALTSRSCISWL